LTESIARMPVGLWYYHVSLTFLLIYLLAGEESVTSVQSTATSQPTVDRCAPNPLHPAAASATVVWSVRLSVVCPSIRLCPSVPLHPPAASATVVWSVRLSDWLSVPLHPAVDGRRLEFSNVSSGGDHRRTSDERRRRLPVGARRRLQVTWRRTGAAEWRTAAAPEVDGHCWAG